MSTETDNMVLRTLYLPRNLDQALKSAAIRGGRSKGDVIRELIVAGLTEKRKEADSYFAEPTGGKKPVRPTAPKGSVVTKAQPRAARAPAAKRATKRVAAHA